MNDLQKLLENAGVSEARGHPRGPFDLIDQEKSDALDSMSHTYQFQVLESGNIEVFTQADDGMRMIANFNDFDNMLNEFGKM